MMAYLSKTPNLLEEMSRLSPALTRYLESLVSAAMEIYYICRIFPTLLTVQVFFSQNVPEIVYTNCSNIDTVELIRRISVHLPKTHCDYHIMLLMLDATFIYEDN